MSPISNGPVCLFLFLWRTESLGIFVICLPLDIQWMNKNKNGWKAAFWVSRSHLCFDSNNSAFDFHSLKTQQTVPGSIPLAFFFPLQSERRGRSFNANGPFKA